MIASPARTLRSRIRRAVLARSGVLARTLLHRSLFHRPAAQPCIDLARDAGIGDVIMCTPVLRAIKRANPAGRIRFYTNFPELVRGLPYIDEVHPFADRPPEAVFLEYTDIVPSEVHIARLLGDRAGIAVADVQPDCVIDQAAVAACRAGWSALPRPWVVVLRRASRYTPNKDWPAASWDALVDRIRRTGTVIEIGLRDGPESAAPVQGVLDLRGDTSIAQLVAIVASADVFVGPVSGPTHIAAAAGTRCVLIIGGYEHPKNAQYAGNIAFYTPLPCAPCWLREPCPFDLTCLKAISVDEVEVAIGKVWKEREALLF